ncbi:T6SS phospholipase effector Tle1-like catalytic domain-containing protein [Pseudomonas sp. GCM10022188]|uniref:T6SS phospholipase effector Tle1-like catalytic domain-containing protein n=1 Tax=Pseudomonas TaxID=286 RepID=UPI001E422F5D|nr:DUF2235 domain-containing protein [Pseudomonas oryzagri]MCC6074547.1 DUF2235 domain-containing protein [Pseudomonas oryzagri]
MSATLTQSCDGAGSALIPQPFPADGYLPHSPAELAANIRQQERDELRAWSAACSAAAARGDADPGKPCAKALHLSLCFDGTNNHEPSDSTAVPLCTSNVARLFHASIGGTEHQQAIDKGFFRYYSPGVGTVFPDIKEYTPSQLGLIGAKGGEDRINWMLTRLIDALRATLTPQKPLLLEETQGLVESMSSNWAGNVLSGGLLENGERKREAALRPKIEELASELTRRREAGQKPEILAMRLYVYGFSRGAAQARTFANWLQALTRSQTPDGTTEYRFAGLPLSIEFLGLFDTVAAVGLADSAPFAAGHMSWADGTMRLPDEVSPPTSQSTVLPEDRRFLKRCLHLVSAHEQRASFPLDSIRRRGRSADGSRDQSRPSSYRAATAEYVYPGMHSDVGGGYPPGDQGKAMGGQNALLSQIPLHHMYREAFKAGAPLQVPPLALGEHEQWRGMNFDTAKEFNLTEQLITRFNAWQAQAQPGPLEQVMEREAALITGWRIDRYAGGIDKQGFYNQRRGKDMGEAEQEAHKRLHERKLKEYEAAQQGKPLAELSAEEQHQREVDIALIGAEEHARLNINKCFEPGLDDRQLRRAAAEFKRDYEQRWEIGEDTLSAGGLVNILLGGTVYLLNEEDEAREYAFLHQQGSSQYRRLFRAPNVPAHQQKALVQLFDEQVHDSRAWFMNSSGLGEREPFTDYFRVRLVHFDNESNKRLSVIASAGRVIGLGIALASVGLSIKRRNPRYLLGLFLPSLATPVLRGKVGVAEMPEINAFDPLTGIALPMLEGMDAIRAFSKDPGSAVQLANALPLPAPLTEETANTPELRNILKAAEAAQAIEEVKKTRNATNLLEQTLPAFDASGPILVTSKPVWLEQAKDLLTDLTS